MEHQGRALSHWWSATTIPEHLSNALLGRGGLSRSPFARPFQAGGFFGKFETDLAMLKF